MSTQLVELRLLLANGTFIFVSDKENKDVFAAARIGLGALGIVTQARVRVVAAFKLKRTAVPYPSLD